MRWQLWGALVASVLSHKFACLRAIWVVENKLSLHVCQLRAMGGLSDYDLHKHGFLRHNLM